MTIINLIKILSTASIHTIKSKGERSIGKFKYLSNTSLNGFNISGYYFTVAEVLMLIPVVLTIWSGWEYTFKAKHYFTEQ